MSVRDHLDSADKDVALAHGILTYMMVKSRMNHDAVQTVINKLRHAVEELEKIE